MCKLVLIILAAQKRNNTHQTCYCPETDTAILSAILSAILYNLFRVCDAELCDKSILHTKTLFCNKRTVDLFACLDHFSTDFEQLSCREEVICNTYSLL